MKNLSIIALTVLIFSCTPKPEACFTASDETIEFGGTLYLNDCSNNAEIVEITWGDGLTEAPGILSHEYYTPGEYTVNITVYSKNRKKYDETSLNISVNEPNTEVLKSNWQLYLVEAFTPSADEAVTQQLNDNGIVGTNLDNEEMYSAEVDFDYSITNSLLTITDEEGESDSKTWEQKPQARLLIGGVYWNVVRLSSTQMILRTEDATQFEEYDHNDEFDTEDFNGYFLFYFRKE